MKKLLVITAFFFALVVFIFFSPHFIKLDEVQDQIIVKLNQALDMEVSIGEVSLHWLPYPHIFIGEVRAQNKMVSVNIAELWAIPDWKSLLYRQLVLGKLKVIDPAVDLKSMQKETTIFKATMVDLDFDIEIENGSLSLPAWAIADSVSLRNNTISRLNADITIQHKRIKYNLSGSSSFCSEITSSGRIDFNNFYYRLDFFYKDFNLAMLAGSLTAPICPVDQENNFSAHIEGVTTKNYKFWLKGNLPSFQLNGDPSLMLSNEYASDISIERYDDDFFVHINKFQLNYPKIDLHGNVSRQSVKDSDLPIWNIDLAGQDLDLNQAREFVLALWGNNEIAQTVCNIVQGGKANSARYVFNGPADDFHFIQKMQIWVDVEDSPIFIPDIDLLLDKATGSISILDGILAGNNLTADISSSSGTNGILLLDLKHDATAFQLDLDLDLDVSRLKNVLANIVAEPGFLNELTHFKDLKGRAKGHLSLGDTFDHLNTTVEVKEISAVGVYDRVPWPFSIQSGSLKVLPGRSEWLSVNALLGPHHIINSSGQVSWEDQAMVNVTDFEANIDGASLFNEGSLLVGVETYTAHDFFGPLVNELQGIIHVTNGQFSGPATVPKRWQYQADLATETVSLLSPQLPGTIILEHGSGEIGNDTISLWTEANFLGDSFQLAAHYQHKNLTYWQGSTVFSGTINQQLIDWLDSKVSLPPAFQIKTPLLAEDVRLTTEGNNLGQFKLTGKLIADKKALLPAILEFDINRLKNQYQNNLSFKNDKETVKLVYNIWDSTPKKTLLTWKGKISNRTFDSFFNKHPLISGSVNGVFSLLNTKADQDESSYSGYIEANNLQWQTGIEVTPFTIDTFLISGNEENIQISKNEISFPNGDSASISGTIITDTKNFEVELKLSSRQLSSESLAKSISFFKKDKNSVDPGIDPKPEMFLEQTNLSKSISGTLEFSVENFMYSKMAQNNFLQEEPISLPDEGNAPSSESIFNRGKRYPWTHIVGEAILADKDIQIDFSSAQLCGVDVHGQWSSSAGVTKGNYFINDTEPLSFENTLPCLGIKQSIIEGNFRLETELTGTPGNWQKGTLKLISPSGVIRKMELLSKIFSVVNFTEFLTFQDLPDMKTEGLQYNDLVLESHIEENKLIIDKGFLKGKGLNLTGQGTMNIKDLTTNFTVFVAPFKMLDSVVTSIPLVGRIIGGKKGAILTFPVKVEGPIGDPSVTPLSPSAIGKATLDFITDTLTLPFAIFTPFTDDDKSQ